MAGHLSFAVAHTKSDTSTDLIQTEVFSEKPLSSVTCLGEDERHHADVRLAGRVGHLYIATYL